MDVCNVALLAIVQRAVTLIGKQVRKTQDGVQWRAQLVAHGGEKLILELACALRFFLCVHKEVLCPLVLGHIVKNDNATLEYAIRAFERSAGNTEETAFGHSRVSEENLHGVNALSPHRPHQRQLVRGILS